MENVNDWITNKISRVHVQNYFSFQKVEQTRQIQTGYGLGYLMEGMWAHWDGVVAFPLICLTNKADD